MADGQHTEHDSVHQTEDSRACADSQGQRCDCDNGEDRAVPQHAKAVTSILKYSLGPVPTPHFVHLFFHESYVAEGAPRGVRSVLSRQAAPGLFFGFEFQVGAKLTLQVSFTSFSAA